MKRVFGAILGVLVFIFICMSANSGWASTIYADDSSSNTDSQACGINLETACQKIQWAVNIANSGDTVLVASGSYFENVRIEYKSVSLISMEGAENTSIQADTTDTVLYLIGTGTSTIEGFTITNGSSSMYGGGIFMQSTSTKITNNIINNNYAYLDGGGIWAQSSSITITNNLISGNTAPRNGGGIATFESNPIITQNEMHSNNARYGAGAYVRKADHADIHNNIIKNNISDHVSYDAYAGGIMIVESDDVQLNSNTIKGNISDNGPGIYCYFSSFDITNNYIANNFASGSGVARAGGGILVFGGRGTSSPKIIHNTIYGNTSANTGGGIDCRNTSQGGQDPVIYNNIISHNTANIGGGVYAREDCNPILDFNNVYSNSVNNYFPSIQGTNDISVDSHHVDADNPNEDFRDWHLLYTSPCIDYASSAYKVAADNDGDYRPVGPSADLGADEYPDGDLDGFNYDTDCDDMNPSIYPGALEVCLDNIDQDCGYDGDTNCDCSTVDNKQDCKSLSHCTWDNLEKYCY